MLPALERPPSWMSLVVKGHITLTLYVHWDLALAEFRTRENLRHRSTLSLCSPCRFCWTSEFPAPGKKALSFEHPYFLLLMLSSDFISTLGGKSLHNSDCFSELSILLNGNHFYTLTKKEPPGTCCQSGIPSRFLSNKQDLSEAVRIQ